MDHAPKQVSGAEYESSFDRASVPSGSKREKALQYALDIRKFEIEMYWKRAAYFWTFIGAALAGFGLIQGSKEILNKPQLSAAVGVLGLVFSFSWYCVNRGSKQWQENWENHVDMLEDDVIGPLYKTVARRPAPKGLEHISRILTGPGAFSVTKINQIVSIFVTILWLLLIYKAVGPIDRTLPADRFIVTVIALGIGACITVFAFGGTHRRNYRFFVERRSSEIIPPSEGERRAFQADPTDSPPASQRVSAPAPVLPKTDQ